MITLKDIANEAGVSVMTVSNVINGNLSKVSKENTQRILEIVERRGYVPNASARSLAKNKTNIIAIILRSNAGENSLENPHNASILGTIIQEVQKYGYYAMVNVISSREDILKCLRSWNVDGAIFLGMFDNEAEDICTGTNIPKVFIDSYSSFRRLSNVGIDDYLGGQLAARHLVQNGHRNIAFISPPILRAGVVQHRFSGFTDELSSCGVNLPKENIFVLESDVRPEEIVKLGRQFVDYKGKITAAFITSDQIASHFIQGLQSVGIKVPDDLSIIGFDNLMISQQITPQLTTISQDFARKASLSVSILLRYLNDPSSPAESMVLDVSLVERQSVKDISEFKKHAKTR